MFWDLRVANRSRSAARGVALLAVLVLPAARAGAQCPSAELLPAGATISTLFGTSLAMDGDVMLVGAQFADMTRGAAWVYRRAGAAWMEEAKLVAADGAGPMGMLGVGDQFGGSVALDGDVALVGAHTDDDKGYEAGTAFVFRRVAGSWVQEAKLTASDGQGTQSLWDEADKFGWSVALDGDYALVGAPGDDDLGSESGSVYVFQYTGGLWVEQTKLVAPDGVSTDRLGYSLDLDGDTAVVGAIGRDDLGTNSGGAYVFRRAGTAWQLEGKLLPSSGSLNDLAGWDVAIDGDRAVVGNPGDDDNGLNGGAASVFRRNAGVWSESARLVPQDLGGGNLFGEAVSVSGDRVAVGVRHDNDLGTDAGSAYVFRLVAGVWTQELKLVGSGCCAGPGDELGYAVAIDGDDLAAGAPWTDYTGLDSGLVRTARLVAPDDCNGNGEPDACELLAGTATDLDGDGLLDECQALKSDSLTISVFDGGTQSLDLDAGAAAGGSARGGRERAPRRGSCRSRGAGRRERGPRRGWTRTAGSGGARRRRSRPTAAAV